MNVNPSSEDFGKVVPWDTLTDEQKASGDWIELPDVSGEPRRARQRSPIESLFAKQKADRAFEREERREHRRASGFDALGRPYNR